MVEFDVKLTLKDVYRFNLYQTYSGTQGWISIIGAVIVWGTVVRRYASMEPGQVFMYIMLGLLLLLYLPVSLYLGSKRRIASTKMLLETLHYVVDETGIKVSQNGENAELKWEQMYRVVATKSNVLIYSNRINAFVVPREQLGEKYAAFAELANAKLEKHRVKMR